MCSTFTDGTSVDVDLIMLATGYVHKVPFAQELVGSEQHPQMYLTAFSRNQGVYGIGFVETNGAAYVLMSQLSAMVASHIADRTERPQQWEEFEKRIATDEPDLSRGINFVDSPRHQGYVDGIAITKYIKKIGKKMGWDVP